MVIVDLIVGINIKIDSICKNTSYSTLHTVHCINMLLDDFVLVVVLVVCLCAPVLISDKTFEKLSLSSYFFHFPFFPTTKR